MFCHVVPSHHVPRPPRTLKPPAPAAAICCRAPAAPPPAPASLGRAARSLLAARADRSAPATWWSHDCDTALLRGMWRLGYAEFDAVFGDPEFAPVFRAAQVRRWWWRG